jgi:hypothetical protein
VPYPTASPKPHSVFREASETITAAVSPAKARTNATIQKRSIQAIELFKMMVDEGVSVRLNQT